MEMDSGEKQFFIGSEPIEIYHAARDKCCYMERSGEFSQALDLGFFTSHNTYFFSKLHVLYGLIGGIHSYALSKAVFVAWIYMKGVKLSYHDCSIYGTMDILEDL